MDESYTVDSVSVEPMYGSIDYFSNVLVPKMADIPIPKKEPFTEPLANQAVPNTDRNFIEIPISWLYFGLLLFAAVYLYGRVVQLEREVSILFGLLRNNQSR